MKSPLTMQDLPDDIDALKALVISSQSDIHKQAQRLAKKDQHIQTFSTEVERLSELVIFFKTRQFYKRSEKQPNQAELFNEPEVEEELTLEKSTDEASSFNPQKEQSKPGRKPLPQNLPRKRIEYTLPVGETCECGAVFKEIGEEESEQLEIIPIKVIVHQLVWSGYTI